MAFIQRHFDVELMVVSGDDDRPLPEARVHNRLYFSVVANPS